MTTKKQKAYIGNRARGLSQRESAIMAGYPDDGADTNKVEASPSVQQELARIRAETAVNCGITKEHVVQMLLDAAEMGKAAGEAQSVVSAAREIGKMLGFYAPEVKKTLVGVDQASLKRALENMDDDDLMKLVNARAIDGEFKRLTEKHGNENMHPVSSGEE